MAYAFKTAILVGKIMPESREQAPTVNIVSFSESEYGHEEDKIQDECGVFGVTGTKEGAVWMALDATITQGNRGEQATGIGVNVNGQLVSIADKGNADVAFRGGRSLEGYSDAKSAVGHNLYTTQTKTELQPVSLDGFLFTKNGNVTNADDLCERYEVETSDEMSDSGKLARALSKQATELGSIYDAIEEVIPKARGAFSIIILNEDGKLILIRDRVGQRPLAKGKLADGSGWAAASETPVFDMIGAIDEGPAGDVKPGTYEVLGPEGVEKTYRWGRALHPQQKAIICGMGATYFERTDGRVEDINIAEGRKKMGEFVAEDNPVEADIAAPYPDSGRQMTTGMARVYKIPQDDIFYKNHLKGKTYTQRVDLIKKAVRLKLNPIRSALEGKRVVAGDDSAVRGNTLGESVTDAKNAGAEEMHIRIAFPPIRNDCHYGMNMQKKDGFLATDRTVEEMAKVINADSLAFNTPERLTQALGRDLGSVCMHCATGKTPEEMWPEQAKKIEEDITERELVLA